MEALSCTEDLLGEGSLDDVCVVTEQVILNASAVIIGKGSLVLQPFAAILLCPPSNLQPIIGNDTTVGALTIRQRLTRLPIESGDAPGVPPDSNSGSGWGTAESTLPDADVYSGEPGDEHVPECALTLTLGGLVMKPNSSIVGGTIEVDTTSASIEEDAVISATGLAGEPPPQTSGTPTDYLGSGGGYGGRGAACSPGGKVGMVQVTKESEKVVKDSGRDNSERGKGKVDGQGVSEQEQGTGREGSAYAGGVPHKRLVHQGVGGPQQEGPAHQGVGVGGEKEVWGGDAYSWSTLEEPWKHGSAGGQLLKTGTGGRGGGRVRCSVQARRASTLSRTPSLSSCASAYSRE